MSIVKFGRKKWGTFKFGQPSKFYLYEDLLAYLPKYIDKTKNVIKGFFRALAIVLTGWHNKVLSLSTYYRTGIPGLKYANEDMKIFMNEGSTDSEIEDAIKNIFNIHQQRGTIGAIPLDIRRYTGDKNAGVEFYNYYQCGWWLGYTHPGISPDGFYNKYNVVCFLGLDSLILVRTYNNTRITDAEIEATISKELLPAPLAHKIMILKPSTLKWGRFKFGLKKFGQPIK